MVAADQPANTNTSAEWRCSRERSACRTLQLLLERRLFLSTLASIPAMAPSSVCIPELHTTPRPRPATPASP